MALVVCHGHKADGDTSLFCFVNEGGMHVAPRDCRCLMVRDSEGAWDVYKPTADQKRRYASHEMPNKDFIELMKKKFGKVNPDCPIEEMHSPIDPRISVKPAMAKGGGGAK